MSDFAFRSGPIYRIKKINDASRPWRVFKERDGESNHIDDYETYHRASQVRDSMFYADNKKARSQKDP